MYQIVTNVYRVQFGPFLILSLIQLTKCLFGIFDMEKRCIKLSFCIWKNIYINSIQILNSKMVNTVNNGRLFYLG